MSLPSKGRPSPQSSPPPSGAGKKATDGPKPGVPKSAGAPNIWEQKKQAQAAAAAANAPFQNIASSMTQMFCVLSKGGLCQVRLKNQERWEGSFVKMVGADSGFTLELAFAQKLGGKSGPFPTRNTNPFERTKVFKDSEIESVSSSHNHASPQDADSVDPHGFATDTQISHRQFKERDLQRWEPDGGDQLGSLDEPSGGPATANWDQFQTNEKLFGVSSTFDFEMYTTELDRNSEFYRKNEREAERIARLIAKESTENVHIAIDRGQDVGEDYDEDRLYSSVDRSADANSTPSKSGVYRPPHLRDKNEKPTSKPSAPETPVPKPTASPPPSSSPAPTTPSAPATSSAAATPNAPQSSASVSSSPLSSSASSSASATPSTSSSSSSSSSVTNSTASAAESKSAEDNKPKKKLNPTAKSFVPRFGPAASEPTGDAPVPTKQTTPQMGPQAAPAWSGVPAGMAPPMPLQQMMPMQSMMPMPPPYYVVAPGMMMPMGQPFMGGAVMAPPMGYAPPVPVRGQPPVGSPNTPAMAGMPPPNFNLQFRPQPQPAAIPPQPGPFPMQPPQPGMGPKFPGRWAGGPA